MITRRGRQRLRDSTVGRVLDRREVLALFGASAGAAVLAANLPHSLSHRSGWRRALGAATAAEPCVVRPDQTEGPYFVNERLNRSDIRSDPSDGSVKEGTRLAIAFAVQRIEGTSCVPLEGALVDLWHCDAAGVYSDVQDPSFDTRGRKFLRGYQRSDANGMASFVTIYPGWYRGRTVHMHFKVRTDPDSATGFEFTSQLYFDDALTDVVHAQQPYAAEGERTLRNDGDGIYRNAGDRLLLTLGEDGAGGYDGTFHVALQMLGTTTTTQGGATTTTLAGGSCATIAACLTNVQSALPEPATATTRKAKRTARRLRNRMTKTEKIIDRAAASHGDRQAKLYARARVRLLAILSLSQAADEKGRLDVPFATIEAAINALLGEIPQ